MLVFRLDVLPFCPFYITRNHKIPYTIKTLSQDLLSALSERGGWLGRSLEGTNRWLIRQLVAKALVGDACTTAEVEYFQRLSGVDPQGIVWIDNAVNPSRFSPAPTLEARRQLGLAGLDPIMGYIGSVPSEYGAGQLVEVAPRLTSRYPNLGILVVGDGPGHSSLEKRAEELGIRDRCVFTGYIPFDEVPVCVNALDVGVSFLEPRLAVASEQKVRQYLACGKPVVVSPGGNDYFLAGSGLGSIIPAADLEGIAAQLDHWLSLTPVERSEFAHRASKYARDNLSVRASVARRLEIWNERLQLRQHGRSALIDPDPA
jgi:glycosyltransferase involved in cell wall biosynthesis